jgi:hypothetical protein
MNRLLKHWRLIGRSEAFSAKVIAYEDDFVILSRGHAHTALERLLPSVIRHTTVIIANAADSRKTAEKAVLTSCRPSRPQGRSPARRRRRTGSSRMPHLLQPLSL